MPLQLCLAVAFGGFVEGLALEEPRRAAMSQGPDLSWLATVIAILLVSILGLAYCMRKVLSGAWRARASRRSLRVVDVLPLGGRRQLAVVRCYDRTFALGLGDKEVALIAELDPEFVAAESPREATAGAAKSAFGAWLDGAWRGVAQRAAARQGSAALSLAPDAPGLTALPSRPVGGGVDLLVADALPSAAARSVLHRSPASASRGREEAAR